MLPTKKGNRRSIRLQSYDYSSAGAYFITICCYEKQRLFGDIKNSQMFLNNLGSIVHEEWHRSEQIRKEMMMDSFVIMPNHIHGIVFIQPKPSMTPPVNADVVGANGRLPLRASPHDDNWRMKPKSLNAFVAGFKSVCTKRINEYRQTPCTPVWQRNYYEHIIRSEAKLERIRSYIEHNPKSWSEDKYYV